MSDTPFQIDAAGVAAQVVAADPVHSVWVSANAGTGKTRVLIDRISRLLLAGTRPERILCLTFTKAAAAEMANRLNDRLGDWAAIKPEKLVAALQALLGRPATEHEEARARHLFAATVEAPEGLRIRTIHSFCESLLGRFPLEAGIAPHFQVIDERRAAELRQESRDQLLQRSLDRGSVQLAGAMKELAGLVDENGFAGVMAELDGQRGRLRAMLRAHGGVDGLIEAGREALGLRAGETVAGIIAEASADDAFQRGALSQAAEALAEGSPTDRERAGVLAAWLSVDQAERAECFLTTYRALFLTQKLEPSAATRLITKKQAAAHPDALDALLVEQDRVVVVQENLKALAIAENTAALLNIGVNLIEAYENLKHARALLDYDDLIGKARDLLGRGDGVSWVHFKLDGGIDHILVDEAQDTSPDQWRVVEALAEDFFSGEGRETSAGRTVFAVGDEKQSIYSFQGADPARFGQMEERFGQRVQEAKRDWRPVQLAHSWRSTPAVLSVVDAVFELPDAADGLSWRGRRIDHPTHRTGQAGRVELWPMTAPMAAASADPWDVPLDQMPAGDPQGQLAMRIAETIDAWVTNGDDLESQSRPITYGDVLVLVRTRGAFAEEMVRALKERGIDVAGRDRLVLTDHLAVMDLIAFGRFALLPDDDLNTAAVLKGPFVEMSEERLFDLARARNGSVWRALGDARHGDAVFGGAHAVLADALGDADRMPPFEFFSHLLGRGGRESLLAHLGPEAADPIDEFVSLALDFERDHVPSLEGFLHWVETGAVEVKRDLEQASGEVRVMTVHGAKGLQAPIVFLVDNGALPARQLQERIRWCGDADAGDYVLWPAFKDNEVAITREVAEAKRLEVEQEYRRLLYVAMTRAEDRLYVTGWHGERGRADGCWHDLVERGLRGLAGTVEIEDAYGPALRFESPQTAPVDQPESIAAVSGVNQELPGWTAEAAPVEPAPSVPISPSRPAEEPPVASPLIDDGARFKRGRLIHALLQTLPDMAPENRQAAAAAYLHEPVHDLGASEQLEIAGEVIAVLENPVFASVFGPGSRAEVPIVGDVGRDAPHVISGQVDRLVVDADEVTVIDFKTNRPPPREESGVSEVYLRQMAAYRAALQQIYPTHQITAVLLWTDGPRAMRLSDELLERYAP